MPSAAYFIELTSAVLMDADEVNGFLQRQNQDERHVLVQRMHERVVATFAKLLEAEMETLGKVQAWQARIEKVEQAAREQAATADVERAAAELEAFVHQAISDYDAFLLKAGLRIRKAFVTTLTK
jgi:hypothetical protein